MSRQEFATNGIRWVYVTKPNAEDIEYIRQLFPFHQFVMESIVAPTLHPFVEDFDNHLFLILHFPIIYRGHQENKVAEIDFLVAKDILVTITYLDFERFDKVYQFFKATMAEITQPNHRNAGFLLYRIIDRLFGEHLQDLDVLEKAITKIEHKIFEKRGHLTVEDISHVRRDIIDFRKPLRSQATVLTTFREKAERFYGKQMAPYLHDLSVTEDRVLTFIENQREKMDMLYETHVSLLSSHISRIISTLTLFSAIILPLSFLASIWGMNQKVMPLRDEPYDFWIVVGIMAAVTLGLLLYFRKKQWL